MSSPRNNHVDIIIPAFNSEKTLRSCLESVLSLDKEGWEIRTLVVDNNSTDRTPEIASQMGIEVLPCKKQGRASARNAGLAHTNSPLVAFVDSDVSLGKDWLTGLLPLLAPACVGAVQGAVVPLAHENLQDRLYFLQKKRMTLGTFVEMESPKSFNPLIDTAAAIYKREALERVEGLNEEMRYLEDVDLSQRLVAMGYSLRSDSRFAVQKESNRNLPSFLKRTFDDSYDMYKFVATHSGRPTLRNVLKKTFLPIGPRDWPSLSLSYLALANEFMWRYGYLHSYFAHLMKPLPYREVSIRPAKLNLLLPIVEEKKTQRRMGLSPRKRFYLSDRTLIIYGLHERELRRYQDKDMIDFFRDYLDQPGRDFSPHQMALERAIDDELFEAH